MDIFISLRKKLLRGKPIYSVKDCHCEILGILIFFGLCVFAVVFYDVIKRCAILS